MLARDMSSGSKAPFWSRDMVTGLMSNSTDQPSPSTTSILARFLNLRFIASCEYWLILLMMFGTDR